MSEDDVYIASLIEDKDDLKEHINKLCVAFYNTMNLVRLRSNWPGDYKYNIEIIDEAMEHIGEEKLCGHRL